MKSQLAIHLHQTHLPLGDFQAVLEYLKQVLTQRVPGLHLFSELFLSGYPLQDLCLHHAFIEKLGILQQQIDEFSSTLTVADQQHDCLLLMGGLAYQMSSDVPVRVQNVIYSLRPGERLQKVYVKRLLPNYDIFDEAKYFTAGTEIKTLNFAAKTLALTVCEDMWASQTHDQNPVADLYQWQKATGQAIDLVVNLSASPYNLGKAQARVRRAQEIVGLLGAPFVYVNRVGIEDEILFDGQSFLCTHDASQAAPKILKRFEADNQSFAWPHRVPTSNEAHPTTSQTPWQSLFAPQWVKKRPDSRNETYELSAWSEVQCQEVIHALCFGIQDFAKKCGFKNFIVANSGGIDSALVLALTKLSLAPGQEVESLFLPSQFSSTESLQLAEQLAKNLGVIHKVIPIKFFHSVMRNQLATDFRQPLEGLTDENIQARLRAVVVYTRSNQTGAMVLNTSNKSEIAVGYSTLYGDSVGALSVIGDLYKTEVYQLAHYINRQHGGPIPMRIIERAPSAELRPDQVDQQTLPSYDRLDAMLEGILSYRATIGDLVSMGFSRAEVEKVFKLYHFSQFKRKQFAPIIKVKNKSFGFGHRVPICKDVQVYI